MNTLKISRYGLSIFLLLGNISTLIAGDYTNAPITPIPEKIPYIKEQADLGLQLFLDKKLSSDNQIACVSCHNLKEGGANNISKSIGANKHITETNTPSIYNSIFNFRYNWDGRSKHYPSLINQMITDPTIMNNTWEKVVSTLKENTGYVNSFKVLFDDGITKSNIISAFYEFQKSLITPNSRFDKYLMGDEAALTADELEGYKLFNTMGCISCHQGVNVGGNLYQKLGIYKEYYTDKSNITPSDYGKYNVTGLEEDKYVFKVPSLRNVALTAPYFHDGSQTTLEDAIETMAIYQLGQPMAKTYVNQIKAFLETLTGEAPLDKM